MALAPGDQLGPYRIDALLGAGGMGEVYRGVDTRLGRHVALKVIASKLVGDASSRKRFENEARAASALNHPSIVTIYDIGESDGVSWIAMEWVDGQTLRAALATGALPVRQAWTIARQLTEALAVAHAKGIVHRDLKPENVMLTADGRPKILDFGLARQVVVNLPDGASAMETAAGAGATFAGTILGTVGYMSPEQAAGRPADFRSDQFSLGLLMYELLTGQCAFKRDTPVETLSAIIRDDPLPIASLRQGASDAFQRLVGQCLSKKPADRFASTRDLHAALDLIEPESIDAPRQPPMVSGAVSVPARPARRWRMRALVAASLLLGTLATAVAVWRWSASNASTAIESLAVLPFAMSTDDSEIAYLADGITESLIEHLSRVPSLKVMARGTVMRFREAPDPQQAGKSLGVGAVVTGTIARRGSQVVISAEMIDSTTGERLWGRTYDQPFGELLHVQDSIVLAIADGLRVRLSGQEKQQLGGYGTENPEAYELFLRAQYRLYRDTEEDDLEARRLFAQAVEKDPNFVEAHLGVGITYARSAGGGYAPPSESLARAGEAIKRARAIDPDNVVVRLAEVSNQFQITQDWEAAERGYRALMHEPAILRAAHYHPIALFFIARGRPDEAVALVERALIVDPANIESRVMLGNFLIQAGRLDDALKLYATIAAAEPDDPRPHFGIADVHKRRGDAARAIEARRKAYELGGDDDGLRAFAKATTEEDYEKADVALARIRLRELQELATERYISPLDLARLHAQVGEHEQALALLERSLADPPNGMTLLKVDHAWDPVRTDPRFVAIVKKLRIP